MCSKTDDTDQIIVERFKKDYTEQFYILVRMHLQFLLDLNTDENDSLPEKGKIKKWNLVPFAKKSKLRSVVEGTPLTQEGINQIFQLIQFLKQDENIKSEGIFRRTGSIERQQELKHILNQGSSLHLDSGNYSVHDCASVLKGFFQDLSDPLLTEVHFPVYCQIAELYDINLSTTQEAKLLEALQLLLLLLPSENKLLLKDLLELLQVTASFESYNRMSPDNLAKLFTPHLLCPRNLTPAVLLKVSQSLFSIVSFMIRKYKEVFKIPSKLILEFRAKYEKKRLLSPIRHLNESTADVASTVFTFVDQECTTKENQLNPTETALAQLYAHIQSLPESSKKRKLVKQFNKENGHGTPLQAAKNSKNRSIGDSIKKHIFQKHLARKKGFLMKNSPCSASQSPLGSPSLVTRARLFCHHNCDSSTDQSHDGQCPNPKRRKASRSCERLTDKESDNLQGKGSLSEPESSAIEDSGDCNVYLTSTPACFPLKACDVFTPDSKDRKSMSPITMSAQRMSRAMQETMMTPRSRKPVLLLSGTNINTLPKMERSHFMDNVTEEKERIDSPSSCFQVNLPFKSKSEGDIQRNKMEVPKINKSDTETILTDTFREYLSNRDIITFYSPQDSSFSSRTDDFNSTNLDLDNLTDGQFSDSLMYCLDGNNPDELNVIEEEQEEKKLVLKPKKFDENGKPIIFETSF